MERSRSLSSLAAFLLIAALSNCTPKPSPVPEAPSPAAYATTPAAEEEQVGPALQAGNSLPRSVLVTQPSDLISPDTRLGWGLYSSNIWNDIPNLDSLLSEYVNFGIKRLDTSMQEIEEPIDWNRSEFEIAPEYDRFIDGLNENGIAVNYLLHFWDKEGRANGETLGTPRFKTEEQLQDFLEYVRFVVSNFKGRVQYYTLWSEPDNCGGSGVKCIEPQDYIELARRVIPVIHQEDPDAKVVTAPNVLFFDREYLFTILRSDVIPMFDVISWHGIYNAAPDSEFYGDYYYEYPALVEEIKQTAHAHGFAGEFWAPEISWCSADYPTCHSPDRPYKILGSDRIAAKYDARSFILHLGMGVGVGWGGLESADAPWTYPTVRRLNTVMAGAEPVEHDVRIVQEPSDTSTYAFTQPDGDLLFAFWMDGVATDDDPDATVSLTFPGRSAESVVGIDVLNGFEQDMVTEVRDGDLLVWDVHIRDYPILLRLSAAAP
jgi:hypothetical protein